MEILPNFSWADTQVLESSIKKEKLNGVNREKSFLKSKVCNVTLHKARKN